MVHDPERALSGAAVVPAGKPSPPPLGRKPWWQRNSPGPTLSDRGQCLGGGDRRGAAEKTERLVREDEERRRSVQQIGPDDPHVIREDAEVLQQPRQPIRVVAGDR